MSMADERVSWAAYFMNMMFFVYFVVLYAERIHSLVLSVKDANVHMFGTMFNRFVYAVLIVSMLAAAVLLAGWNRDFFAGLFSRSRKAYNRIDYGRLSIAAGALLFSGMVHTEHTIPPVQFVSYGALIIAMALKNVLLQPDGDYMFMRWFSFAYLTAFSMAIPVMYHSQIKEAAAFHVIEAVVMAALVTAFTLMMRQIFVGSGTNLFYVLPIVIAVLGDAVILVMRWREKVNGFVLIFIAAAAVMWCVGKILSSHMLKA